jgi:hypothetical protein
LSKHAGSKSDAPDGTREMRCAPNFYRAHRENRPSRRLSTAFRRLAWVPVLSSYPAALAVKSGECVGALGFAHFHACNSVFGLNSSSVSAKRTLVAFGSVEILSSIPASRSSFRPRANRVTCVDSLQETSAALQPHPAGVPAVGKVYGITAQTVRHNAFPAYDAVIAAPASARSTRKVKTADFDPRFRAVDLLLEGMDQTTGIAKKDLVPRRL